MQSFESVTRSRPRLLVVGLAVLLACTAVAVPATRGSAASPAPHEATCDNSWSELDKLNPLEEVRAGRMRTAGHEPVQVAEGSDVDWTLDPFKELTWRMWLDTMAWTGALVNSYDETGNVDDLNLALAYMKDYVKDRPMTAATPDEPFRQQTSRRLQVMTCLYERAPSPWLATAMNGTIAWVAKYWAGAYNHGQDQDLSILNAACLMGRDDWITFARDRMARTLKVSIDDSGATNEQSTGYARYSYERWAYAEHVLSVCGQPPLPTLATKLKRAKQLVAFATLPDGKLIPIGDTFFGSRGITGVNGLATSGAWAKAGFAFGRNAWAPNPTIYALRWGPPRQIHGNLDHGSVSLFANNAKVITEPASVGYMHPAYAWFQRAPEAKNSLLVGDGRCASKKTAPLRSQSRTATVDKYVIDIPGCGSAVSTRAVSFNRTAGTLSVADWSSVVPPHRKPEKYTQLWHLMNDTEVAVTKVSRTESRITLTMANGSIATMTVKSSKKRPFVVRVVTGQNKPYQGWISGGMADPIAAPVIQVKQRARQVDLQTTIRIVSGPS